MQFVKPLRSLLAVVVFGFLASTQAQAGSGPAALTCITYGNSYLQAVHKADPSNYDAAVALNFSNTALNYAQLASITTGYTSETYWYYAYEYANSSQSYALSADYQLFSANAYDGYFWMYYGTNYAYAAALGR